MSAMRRYRLLILPIVVLVSTAGLLFAAEALLAWRTPPATFRYVRLREHLPGTDRTFRMPESVMRDPESLDRPTVHLGIDDSGFIEPSRIHADADFTVVFLGGSTTECLFVPEDRRFPYLVGRQLEATERFGKVNAFNGGRAANHSGHSLAALIGKGLPLEPDVAVMMHNCNDLLILMFGQTYWSTQVYDRELVTWAGRPDEAPRGLLRRWFPHLSERLLPPVAIDSFAPLRGRKTVIDRSFIEREFTRSLRGFVALCRAWDITPVLMTQANRITDPIDPALERLPQTIADDYRVSYDEFRETYHWMNDLIRKVGTDTGTAVVDLAARIDQSARYLYDPYHLNEAGCARAADLIVEELSKLR